MRRLTLALIVPAALGCGRDLTLPENEGNPRILRLEPSLAIASLETEVTLVGEDLAMLDEVAIGPFVMKGNWLRRPDPDTLVVRLAGIDPEALEGIDGSSLPVRAFGPTGEVVAPGNLRVFSG